MQTINEFTVPRINGQSTIYNYHIYDQNDTTALISGIDTNSCFKVSGVDNDFIHYCLLNKNGFIVKIEDKDGNFVGRISGFRNGNGIYFNELRSIYDYDKNIKTSLTHSTIRQGLLDVLKDIAKDIIDTCRKNGEQVDFATVIKYFVLSTVDNDYYGYDISQDLSKHFIHNGPMNTNTPDWQEFINTPNLIEKGHRFNGITEPGFLTDYQYGTTIMVVDSRIGTLTKDKIITYDPEPLYIRERYIKEDIINIDNINYFNKIKAINCNLNNTKFEPINLIGKHIIYGLNWYIIYDESIIETSINNKDSKSILEYRLTYNNLIEKQKIKRL